VPTIDLPADELAAVTAAIRGVIEGGKRAGRGRPQKDVPILGQAKPKGKRAPRVDPLRAALARFDAAAAANAAPGQPDVKENKAAQNHVAEFAATAPAKSSFPKKLASKPTPAPKAPPPAKADKRARR
jgi:hypothetical protein